MYSMKLTAQKEQNEETPLNSFFLKNKAKKKIKRVNTRVICFVM